MLLVHICLYNLEYISVSNILGKDLQRDSGLKYEVRSSSPFLLTGFIIAYFSLSRNVPEERDLLQI